MIYMRKNDDIILQQIANHLIINSSFLTDLGLYHGKIGILVFFYNYARYTRNPIYEEFADELLDEIFNEVHDNIGIDFEKGLSGIGWGILYLLEKQFVAGDPNDILEDIDMKMMEVNLQRVRDFSLERGITGFSVYLSYRLSFLKDISYFDTHFVSSLQQVISDKEINVEFDLSFIINQCAYSSMKEIGITSLGLHNGYAGYGLKLMTK